MKASTLVALGWREGAYLAGGAPFSHSLGLAVRLLGGPRTLASSLGCLASLALISPEHGYGSRHQARLEPKTGGQR